MSASPPLLARLRRRNDAPPIDERAATRGRIATKGGHERAGVKRRYPFARQPRESDRTAGTSTPLAGTGPTEAGAPKPIAPNPDPNVRRRNARARRDD
jgi:hypothetical protein